jgi:hypothetical protein
MSARLSACASGSSVAGRRGRREAGVMDALMVVAAFALFVVLLDLAALLVGEDSRDFERPTTWW